MEIDLFFAAYCAALFALPIILYKVAIPNNNGREKREKDWYYALKRILCWQKLNKFMHQSVELLPNGPQTPESSWEEDLLTFHAVDLDNNSFYLRFAVGKTSNNDESEEKHELNFAEIVLQLRLSDGRVLTLPEDVLLCTLRAHEWRTKVLTITRQLDGNFRLVFNGFLKDISQNQCRVTLCEHVAFNCLFSKATDQLVYPKFFDRGLFGDAVCRVQWRDGNWTNNLGDQIGQSYFGLLHGTIRSENFNLDQTISMPAYNNRRFGTADRYECSRSLQMLSVIEDGTVIFVENKRTAYSPSCQIRHGAVLLPNGDCIPITGCDLPLPDAHGTTTTMTVHTSTGRKQIKSYLAVDNSNETKYQSIYSEGGYDLTHKLAETSTSTGRGVSSLLFLKRTYSSEPNHKMALIPPVGTNLNENNSTCAFTLDLSSPQAQNVNLTGGKAQSLSILASLQSELDFIVPPGFVVTTKAMDAFMYTNSGEFRKAMTKLKMAATKTTTGIMDACVDLQKIIIDTPLSTEIQESIRSEVNRLSLRLNKNGVSFAVRSSGVSEDSEVTSAAGQNETFLGCRSDDEVLLAVKKCWASLYAFRSVEYRRHHGLDMETTMGVVVQVMIDSRIAGVLFTCDLDGNPGKLRITSNYGLGETIVSGSEGGDITYVRRTFNNNLSIDSEEVNPKKTKIQLCPDRGTKTIYLSESSSKDMSLSQDEALTLSKIATQLEDKYQKHLDIEWAFDKNQIVLLQARPVTFLENWTDYELEHEFDTPVLCPKNIYSTANVKEVMPGAMTPLTNSIIIRAVDESVGRSVAGNYNQRLTRRKYLVTMHHHVFIDFFHVLMAAPSDQIDLTTRAIDISVCGHPVTTPEMLQRAILMHGRTTKQKIAKILLDMFKSARKVVPVVEEAQKLAGENFVQNGGGSGVKDLLYKIDRHLDNFEKIINAHTIASRASSSYQMLAMNILTSEKGSGDSDGSELTPEKCAKIALLLSNGSGVISAEIPADLEDIACEIRKSEFRLGFVDAGTEEFLKENIPEAFVKYGMFVEKHGHRSDREFELMENSWGKDTEKLLKMLVTLSKLDNGTKKSAPLSIDGVVQQLGSQINKKFLKFLIGKCRASVVYREKSKSEVVRHVNNLRLGFMQLGERLCQLKMLPKPDLVYFLTYQEIKALVTKSDPVFIAKAMRRQRLYDTWNSYKFPEMSAGIPNPVKRQPKVITGASAELTGTPVCAGHVQARCCCIDDLKDINQLLQGDVLITHGTDVAWTPYFPMLSGVVTELGGLISHGAVVAREYGLPCLVGVANALETFQTGDIVVLDATKGRLYKI